MFSNIKKFLFFIVFFAAIDQITKLFVIYYFEIDVDRLNSTVLFHINDYLNFYFVWNKGFAFGLFQNDINLVNNIYMILILLVIIILFIYATTINKSALYLFISLIKARSYKFIGSNTGMLFLNAVSLTELGLYLFPLPCLDSVTDTTATTS